ncbi:MAG TPA: hypothetical protein PK467_07450 [Candidatus Wallbacteria bacterium]|nr:hypothetical protein [Candidatus Wallbacteria bacterium]
MKLSVMMNETGSVYLLCLKSNETAPTAAQVKAGLNASGDAVAASMKAAMTMDKADSESVYIFSGLETGVEYCMYAAAQDGYGELQAAPAAIRATTPDNRPPVWTSGYPAVLPSYYSARINLSADKISTVYLVCLNSGAAAPTAAQVKAGTDASGEVLLDRMKGNITTSPGVTAGFDFSQLAMGARYDVYLIAENQYGVAQAEVSKLSFYTLIYVIPSPTLYGGSASKDSLYTFDADDNGCIDHIVVRFSKNMKNSGITKAGFTVAGYTVATVTTDADGVVAAALDDGDGADSQYALIKVYEGPVATGATPAVTINANSIAATDGTSFTGLSATSAFDKILPRVDPSTLPATNSFTITLSAASNSESATAYFVCLPDGAAAPSSAQIKAGTDAAGNAVAATRKGSTSISPTLAGTLNATGLASNTMYNVYMVIEDAASNIKTMPKINVQTDSEI